MRFIDLAAQQRRIRDRIDQRIKTVLEHGQYIMGPEVGELESILAGYAGVNHAVSCGSGTDALLMALMALGVGGDDMIITTPFTFIATAEVISLLGARPVFADIDPKTYNICPSSISQCIDKTPPGAIKGIIAVDLFGLPADYSAIMAIAAEHGLFVLGDAAQSFGSEVNYQKACAMPDISATSFFPAKPLGCYGDGGMCFSNDTQLAEALRSIRAHGKGQHKYENDRIGINGRLDTIQAAILLEKFSLFPEEIILRNQVAKRYGDYLSDTAKDNLVLPTVPDDYVSAWAQYSVLARDAANRQILMDRLKEKDIPTAIYYPKPLHLQKAFASLGYRKGDFPVSEDLANRIFSLPMHPYLDENEQEQIAEALRT